MIFYMHECEQKLGYEFKDKNLLRACFTHSSYSHEHLKTVDNERLEFFGDSILGFITAEYLVKKFPTADEGTLTGYKQMLVSKKPLAKVIADSGLSEFVLYGEGERKSRAENHVSANEDLFEAIVAGIYIDGGLAEAEKFIKTFLFSKIKLGKVVETGEADVKDPKNKLQEYVQKNKLGDVKYEQVSRSGPDHDPVFTMRVKVGGKELATASGKKKTEAERECANKAYRVLTSKKPVKKAKISEKKTKKGKKTDLRANI